MKKVPELFGSMVFNEAVMKERLPKDVYKSLKQTVRQGTALDPQVAGVVANAMKDWAIEKGATHFTHWFQPMLQKTVLPEREHRQSVWTLQSRCFPDIRHWWLLILMVTMNPEIFILISSSTVCERL